MKTIKILIFSYLLFCFVFFLTLKLVPKNNRSQPLIDPLIHDPSTVFDKTPFWKWECIDTMKYSRDTAKAWDGKEKELVNEINSQILAIKESGANCVSLGTPYDDEFIQFLSKWVTKARQNNLHVWFRGNFSGWEEWFEYPKLEKKEDHLAKTFNFILNNSNLFENDDIFTPAPEPENGVFGNPWKDENSKKEFNTFLIQSFETCQKAFTKIGKKVKCGAFSTNYDVAEQAILLQTAKQVGDITIDHYIANTEQYGSDIQKIFNKFNVPVFIGEFGAPIPDLNGDLDENEQEKIISLIIKQIYEKKDIVQGLNYWTLKGGSTEILKTNGEKRIFCFEKLFSSGIRSRVCKSKFKR